MYCKSNNQHKTITHSKLNGNAKWYLINNPYLAYKLNTQTNFCMKKVLMGLIALVMCLSSFKEISNTEFTQAARTAQRSYSDEQVLFIGSTHNEFLETIFRNFNYSNGDKMGELRSQLNNLGLSSGEPNWDLIADYKTNMDKIKDQLSQESYYFINKAIDLSSDIDGFESFANSIDVLKEEAKNKIEGSDLDCVLITLEVFKKSASFWLPLEMGGSGKGFAILGIINPTQFSTVQGKWHWPGWTKVLASDAGSAGVGCLVVACTGGVGLLPMVAGAAGSSAWTALGG
jgi:hypothetical protein